jgi:hypothetical protein
MNIVTEKIRKPSSTKNSAPTNEEVGLNDSAVLQILQPIRSYSEMLGVDALVVVTDRTADPFCSDGRLRHLVW